MSEVDHWRTVDVHVIPFPGSRYTERQFDDIGDALVERYKNEPDDTGFSQCDGVLTVTFHNSLYRADIRASQVAALLAKLGIEASEIYGRVSWTVMNSVV